MIDLSALATGIQAREPGLPVRSAELALGQLSHADVVRRVPTANDLRLAAPCELDAIPGPRATRPIFTTVGGTAGIGQRFNRFDLSVKGDTERTVYQHSTLTDGSISSIASAIPSPARRIGTRPTISAIR